MARPSQLEAQLAEITREFVARIVMAIRSASFAEVAGLGVEIPIARGSQPGPGSFRGRGRAAAPADEDAPRRRGRRPRQTADKRAELADRIVSVLSAAGQPLGVRALAGEIGTAADILAVPLRELREQGRIKKIGEKRNTTYVV
jgi:hypothetical protein